MNRVFYFSGHRLTVFHWDFKQFQGACSFEPDTYGLNKFKQYLETSEKSPARLLVDVIEEDFRIEKIPYVYGRDRKAVIDRLLDRHYRSSGQYTYAEIIGREKTGRKDSRVLLGGVTNPGLIDMWKDIIEECQVPLIGIWTLPLISGCMLSLAGEKKGAVLLVSQQVNSNLRQTFFRDGKMLSSRQSVINQGVEDLDNIEKYAAPEVARTVNFLRNQRLIEPNEKVHIHIIGIEGQVSSIENEFRTDPLNDVTVHSLIDLQTKAGLQGLSGKFSDGLLTWYCARKLALQAHYGNVQEYSQYYYMLGSKALRVVSVLLLLSALVVTEGNLSSAIEHKRSIELLGEQANEYKEIYKKRFEQYETVFEHARSMNAAVVLADRIYHNSNISPLDFMIEVSNVLSQPDLGVEHVDKIEWKIEQYKVQGEEQVAAVGGVDETIEDPIRHVGVLYGRIAVSDKNYRVSVSKINQIISALQQHERIESVEAIQMAVEVRSEKTFNDESGLNAQTVSGKEKGKFALKIIMKAAEHG